MTTTLTTQPTITPVKAPAAITHRSTPADILAYAEAVAPEVARDAKRVIAKYPELEKRAALAALLVIEGKVHVLANPRIECSRQGTAQHLAAVEAQGDSRNVYSIFTTTADGFAHPRPLHCTCPDAGFATRLSPNTCKHIIAYVIAPEK